MKRPSTPLSEFTLKLDDETLKSLAKFAAKAGFGQTDTMAQARELDKKNCDLCKNGDESKQILVIGTPSGAVHIGFARLTEALAKMGAFAVDLEAFPQLPKLSREDTIVIDEVFGAMPRQSMKSMLEAASLKPMLPWDEMEEPEDKPHHCHKKCKHQDRGFCLKKGGCNK